jgi:hypothetical protein
MPTGVRVLRPPLWLVAILRERRARDRSLPTRCSPTRWADTVQAYN